MITLPRSMARLAGAAPPGRRAGARGHREGRRPALVMVGARGSGKSSIMASVVERLRDNATPHRAGATTVWPLGHTTVIELSDEPLDADASAVAAGVRHVAPGSRLDGIALVIAASDLARRPAGALRVEAGALGALLGAVAQLSRSPVSIHVLLTQCDVVEGFDAFWSALGTASHDQILGWAPAHEDGAVSARAAVASAFTAIGDGLADAERRLALDGHGLIGREDAFLFRTRLLALRQPLAEILEIALERAGTHCRIGGLYCAGALRAATPAVPDGWRPPPSVEPSPILLHDLFRYRLASPEQPTVPPPDRTRWRAIRAIQASIVAALVALVALPIAWWQTIDGARRDLVPAVAELASRVSDRDDGFDPARARTLLAAHGFLDGGRLRSWSVPDTWSDALELQLRQFLDRTFRQVVSQPVRARLDARVRALASAVDRPAGRTAFLDATTEIGALSDSLDGLGRLRDAPAPLDGVVATLFGSDLGEALARVASRSNLNELARRDERQIAQLRDEGRRRVAIAATTWFDGLFLAGPIEVLDATADRIGLGLRRIADARVPSTDDIRALGRELKSLTMLVQQPEIAMLGPDQLTLGAEYEAALQRLEALPLFGRAFADEIRNAGNNALATAREIVLTSALPGIGPLIELEGETIRVTQLATRLEAQLAPFEAGAAATGAPLSSLAARHRAGASIAWDGARLQEALQTLQRDRRWLDGMLEGLPAGVATRLAPLAASQAVGHVRRRLDAALLVEPSGNDDHGEAARANFAVVAPRLGALLDALHRQPFDELYQDMRWLVLVQAFGLLEGLDQALRREPLYVASDLQVVLNDIPDGADPVTRRDALASYLELQRRKLQELATQASPLLEVLDRRDIGRELGASKLVETWRAIAAAALGQRGRFARSLQALEQFVTTGPTPSACQAGSRAAAGDPFAQWLGELARRMPGCGA